MSCDITIFRETVSSHPIKQGVTLVEREEFWSDSSWMIGELFALANDVGPNQMFWTYPTDIAKCAADMLDSHAVQLSKEDVEVLEDLIETCKMEDPNGFSWTMIIDW